jgi:hypothetical protein
MRRFPFMGAMGAMGGIPPMNMMSPFYSGFKMI